MELKTFKAPTMAEALTLVKTTMGSDAVILHTRTVQTKAWMGLRRQEMVEITAAKGLNIGPRRRPAAAAPAGVNGANGATKLAAAGVYTRGGAAPPARSLAPEPPRAQEAAPRTAVEGARQIMESPAGTSAAVRGLSQEITALKSMVKDLVDATRRRGMPDVPQDLFEYYTQLIQNEVAEEIATDIIQTIQKQVRRDRFGDTRYINEKIAEQLEKIVPIASPIQRTKAVGPHVVALIGPTGVGKTTTLAKIAANLKLREKRKVALITLDTYRIAAVDQLKRYADILGAPLRVVAGSDELKEALAAMSEFDFILIDTAGRSPNDALKLHELRTVLEAAKPDEVHLVLSTTSSQECVELAANRFGEVRVDKIIFTKVDEAAHLGVVLNVAKKVNIGLSYITTGQDVPDDIEVGRGSRLAQLILGQQP